MRFARALVILSFGGLLAGCATAPLDPSFHLTVAEARRDLDAMASSPRPLARPVLILGAFMDPGFSTVWLETPLRRVTQNGRFTPVTFADCISFDECRQLLIKTAELEFPSADPHRTVQFDVVAASMGGVVARYAARPDSPLKQLRIARLFTIASPHRGAMLANWPTLMPLAQQMRPGSSFLRQLNSPPIAPDYQIIPYVWTNDAMVGAGNAAPPGMVPWWLPPIPWENPHIGALNDPRIIADIARRLRGEKPYTVGPPASLPPSATATRS